MMWQGVVRYVGAGALPWPYWSSKFVCKLTTRQFQLQGQLGRADIDVCFDAAAIVSPGHRDCDVNANRNAQAKPELAFLLSALGSMCFQPGNLDILKQWRDIYSAHRLAFRRKGPSVWPRDIPFRAFTWKAKDERFNIDLLCIGVDVKIYRLFPSRREPSLPGVPVSDLSQATSTATYLCHDALRAPIVAFYLGVVTWHFRTKVRRKLLDISQDLSSQRYSSISPAEKAWMVGLVVKALDYSVPNKSVSFYSAAGQSLTHVCPVKCFTCSLRWIIPFSFSTPVKHGAIPGTSEFPPTTITTYMN